MTVRAGDEIPYPEQLEIAASKMLERRRALRKRVRRTGLGAVTALLISGVAVAGRASGPGDTTYRAGAVRGGAVEHTIWQITRHPATDAEPTLERVEQWVAGGFTHSITTDAETGAVLGETFQDEERLVVYDGLHDTTFRSPGPGGQLVLSRAQEADVVRKSLQEGRLRRSGTTVLDGRSVMRLVSRPGAKARVEDLVEPQTLAPLLRRRATIDASGRRGREVHRLVLSERLDLRGLPERARTMGSHPASKIGNVRTADELGRP